MGKKCIPGLFCVGNMTLFLFFILLLFIVFLLFQLSEKSKLIVVSTTASSSPISSSSSSFLPQLQMPPTNVSSSLGNNDLFNNPYVPPLRNDTKYNIRPISTQNTETEYRQIGILTRNQEILPLMGKKASTTRYKWKYYTINGGGNGNLQTKLPVSVKGKSCTGDNGCDEIYNNDNVYVEGFKDIFVATIYENNTFEYVP
jgi:hypothetical protein